MIIGGGLFAGTETALASVNRIRMMSYADDGDRRARRVLYLLGHFDMALSTLLIGNNIMHIGAASVATLWATKTWGLGAVTAVTAVTTAAVFLFSEMLPKSYAKACSEKFALASAAPLILLMKVIYPVSWLFARLGGLVNTGGDDEPEPTVSEDDLHDIIDVIEKEGSIDEETTDLVKNVLEFTDTPVKDVITPWENVTKLTVGMNRERVLAVYEENLYSRYPVLSSSGDVLGILQMQKYLKACAATKGRVPITTVMARAIFVDVTTPIDDLLKRLSSAMTHMAIVRQEGEIIGIVTVEDILEELVGEIYDESDEESGRDEQSPGQGGEQA
jgi:CBS domain containing-hemolysin-like protein